MAGPTRVGIDLLWLDGAERADVVHAVTTTLVALADVVGDDVVPVLFGAPSLADTRPELVASFETHLAPVAASVAVVRAGLQRLWLPRAIGTRTIDVVHDPSGMPSTGALPARRLLSVHDLTALERPRTADRLRRVRLRRAVPAAIAAADALVAPSAFVRDRLVGHLGVDVDRIHLVPWPLPDHPDPAPMDTVRARTGIIGRFVLLLGATHTHNEQIVAVRAMQFLSARHAETTLVLAGGEGSAEDAVVAEIARLGLEHRVVRIPEPSPAVRSALIEQAAALVSPAVYGGFASTVLEAMASGVPVVVCDAGAAVDLVDGAGAVIPPSDDAQLAVELHRILEDREWRDRMVADGLARAAGYTARRSAEALLAAYRSAAVDL